MKSPKITFAALALALAPFSHADLVIDDFNIDSVGNNGFGGSFPFYFWSGPGNPESAGSDSGSEPSMLGAERDVVVVRVAPNDDPYPADNVGANGGRYLHSQGVASSAYTATVWDGADSSTNVDSTSGLGGLDFSAAGDRISLDYNAAVDGFESTAAVTFYAFSSANEWSQATFTFGASTPEIGIIEILLEDFSQGVVSTLLDGVTTAHLQPNTNAAGAADFSSITAFGMVVDGTNYPALDISFDNLRVAVAVSQPGTGLLLASILCGLVCRRTLACR